MIIIYSYSGVRMLIKKSVLRTTKDASNIRSPEYEMIIIYSYSGVRMLIKKSVLQTTKDESNIRSPEYIRRIDNVMHLYIYMVILIFVLLSTI
jgi:hypothetical protein